MHQSSISRTCTTYRISGFRVCIYEGSFDFDSSLLIHAMPMNNMPDLKSKVTDFMDSPDFMSQVIGIFAKCAFHMVKDSVVLAFAYIEGLAVAWIDKPINVILEMVGYFFREHSSPFSVDSGATLNYISTCVPTTLRRQPAHRG